MNRLAAKLQADLPLDSGSHPAVVSLASAAVTPPTGNGIQFINAGIGGTTSADYITDTTRDQIIALAPRAILHMVGANDFNDGTPVATFKSNVKARLEQFDAALSGPVVHILVHQHERYNKSSFAYPWADYGRAMAELAASRPSNTVFIDISKSFRLIGIPSTDPLTFMQADKVHLRDAGHEYLAEIMHGALRARPTPYDSIVLTLANTVAPTITGLAAAGSTITATAGTWSPTPVTTTYQWYANGVAIGGGTSASLTLAAPDVGKVVHCVVTVARSGYLDASASTPHRTVYAAGDITTGLMYEFDPASLVASIADGADVASYTSSTGTAVTVASAAGKPSLVHSGPNAKPYLHFDAASSEYLRTTSTTAPEHPTSATYALVMKRTAAGTFRAVSSRSNSAYHTIGMTSGASAGVLVGATSVGAFGSRSIIDEWVVVVAVVTPTETRLYINHDAPVVGTSASTISPGLVLGANNGLTGFLTGEMGKMRAYSRALAPSDVAALVQTYADFYALAV